MTSRTLFGALLLSLPVTAAARSASLDRSAECIRSAMVKMSPGETLEAMDQFRASLAPSDRDRLDRALPRGTSGGIAQCDSVEGSRASCEAAAYLPALRATGLMPRFLAAICPKHP